jgi:hypothetical protein
MVKKTFGEFFHTGSPKIMDGTKLESSDEEEIILQKSAESQVQKGIKEPEKYQILTRSKAIINAVEDEDS